MKHVHIYEDGMEPRVGIYTPCMAIDAVGGKVVAYVGSDTEEYSEFFIDFVRDDGKVMQLACVGQRHTDDGEVSMHGDVWNGTDDCPTYDHEIEVSERSFWYDYGKNPDMPW